MKKHGLVNLTLGLRPWIPQSCWSFNLRETLAWEIKVVFSLVIRRVAEVSTISLRA
jgi:hypothetical protein